MSKISVYSETSFPQKPAPINSSQELREEEAENPYCDVCGGCGFIGCCGIKSFLEAHVIGKTNCMNEAMFVHEILEYLEQDDDISGVEVVKSEASLIDGEKTE